MKAHDEFETNVFGIVYVAEAFAVTAALDGLAANRTEVLRDEISGVVKSTLTSGPSRYATILGG